MFSQFSFIPFGKFQEFSSHSLKARSLKSTGMSGRFIPDRVASQLCRDPRSNSGESQQGLGLWFSAVSSGGSQAWKNHTSFRGSTPASRWSLLWMGHVVLGKSRGHGSFQGSKVCGCRGIKGGRMSSTKWELMVERAGFLNPVRVEAHSMAWQQG